MQFAHTNQAQVGQVRFSIIVACGEIPKMLKVARAVECYANPAPPQQCENMSRSISGGRRFSAQYRLAGQQRQGELRGKTCGPRVMLILFLNKATR